MEKRRHERSDPWQTKADSAEIPILAMTAQASTESIHQCELAGMNECIFKPVNAKELIGLLQDIVEKI